MTVIVTFFFNDQLTNIHFGMNYFASVVESKMSSYNRFKYPNIWTEIFSFLTKKLGFWGLFLGIFQSEFN
jgi:hypothetical protein